MNRFRLPALVVPFAAIGIAHAQTTYHVSVVAPFFASNVSGFSIAALNDAGDFAGTYRTSAGYTPYLYRGGTVQAITTPGENYRYAVSALNNTGTVVGNLDYGSYNDGHAYTYLNGVFTPFSTALYPDPDANAMDVNDAGAIVGYSQGSPNYVDRATLWQNGQTTLLPSPSGATSTFAFSVNSSGSVLATAYYSSQSPRVFLLDGTAQTDLGEGSATVLNNVGQAILRSYNNPGHEMYDYRTVFWSNGVRTDIGDFGDTGIFRYASMVEGHDINDAGQIVGTVREINSNPLRGFLYQNGSMVDLTTLVDGGWTITSAQAINASGIIAATATRNGVTTDVLLKPVPEPASLIALGLGSTAFLRRRRS